MSHREPDPDRVLRRAIAWLLALTVLFILYASLYPFNFDLTRLRALPESWQHYLAWRKPPRTDLIANLLFYIPLGIWVASLTPHQWSTLRRSVVTISSGAALSLVIELLQFTTRSRVPALADVLLNTLSAGLGAALAFSARGLGLRSMMPQLRAHRPDLIALLLIVLWVMEHAMPFMPAPGFLRHLREPAVLLEWDWSLAAIAGYFVGWALLGLALRTVLQPSSFWAVFAGTALLLLLSRIVIRKQDLHIDECVGLLMALPLLVIFKQPALRAAFWLAPAMIFFLLAPFNFPARDAAIDWWTKLPLTERTASGESGLLELIYLNLGFVWLLTISGINMSRCVATLFLTAGLIEMAQALQPGKHAHALALVVILCAGALQWLEMRIASQRRAF